MSDYLPEEIKFQIFSRLPSKSLLRFSCLSKSFNTLISSSEFIWLHTQQSVLLKPNAGTIMRYFSGVHFKKEIFVLSDASEDVDTVTRLGSPFHGVPNYFYCRIIGLCNGVLCLSNDLFENENHLVLWNPRINRYLTLPQTPLSYDNSGTYMFVLGFGFASKTGDYKVVRMAYAHGDDQYLLPPKVEVYSLNSGIWKDFDNSIPNIGVVEYFYKQVVICGKIHWTAYHRNGERRVKNLLMVFDLNEEIFQKLSLPEILVNEPPANLNVAECGESLAVYQYDSRIWSNSCSIWIMKRYGDTESWSNEYTIDHRYLGMVLDSIDYGEIFLTGTSGSLILYNPAMQSKEYKFNDGTKYSFYFGNYDESLVLLDKGELLPPVELSYEELTDDDVDDDDDDEDEEENYVEKNTPRMREFLMHHVKHQRIIAFLRA